MSTPLRLFRLSRFLLLPLCIFALGAAARAASKPGERYALVIGIDDYEALGKLKTCRADAKALAKVLVENCAFPRENVVLLTDDQEERKDVPTWGMMRVAAKQMATLPERDDTVLIFFSGHGVTVDGEGYLVPLDGDGTGGIALSWLKAQLGKCKARTKFLVLDACHAGSAAKGVGGIARDVAKASGLVMLLSCSANQVSYPDEATGHSVFSQHLIAGLAGAADANKDKAITHDELFAHVKKRVNKWCLKTRKTQTPVLFGEVAGPLTLAKLVEGKPFVLPGARGQPPRRGDVKAYADWPFDAAEARRRQKVTAAALGVPVEKTVDLGGGVKLELVLIPAGEFLMGSPGTEDERDGDEGPQHRVRITNPFYIGKHEITQEQWERVMGSNPSHFKGAENPVEQVSWSDCQEFAKKLSAKFDGLTFALPTEAEWEYACRAGTGTPFHTGETIATDQANYGGNYTYGGGRKGVWRKKTAPVGSFRPNAFGLFDVHGNVWEWCQDWYADNYPAGAQTDPTGPARGEYRVLRGGSWFSRPRFCRSATRRGVGPSNRRDSRGCRLVLRDF